VPRTDDHHEWPTIDQAAQALGVSPKTIRRRLASGDLAGAKVHDADIGAERWRIDPASFPTKESGSDALVPVALHREITDLHERLSDALAASTRAQILAEFEKERRESLEAERDRLMAELDALRSRRWWQRRK
jgi:hypothetical protein